MARYDTVLFDLDGTLLDTLEDLWVSVNHILQANGYPTRSRLEVRRFLGNGSRALLENALPGPVEQVEFERLFADYQSWYTAHCQEKTRPYPHVEELLSALSKAGCATAIVSNKHASAVEELNDRFFHAAVAVGQTPALRVKPAPDMVEQALSALGRGKERTVYVGDSEVDFATAQNAGLPCVLVSWGFRDREELERLGPLFLADTREQLQAFLLGE